MYIYVLRSLSLCVSQLYLIRFYSIFILMCDDDVCACKKNPVCYAFHSYVFNKFNFPSCSWFLLLFGGVFIHLFFLSVYKKYGVTCCAGITRSVSGTALNMIGCRSLEVLKFKIDATLPHR